MHARAPALLTFFLLFVCASFSEVAVPQVDNANPLVNAQEAMLHGQLEQAASDWETALDSGSADSSELIDVRGQLAGVYLRLGKYPQAIRHLRTALQSAVELNDLLRETRLRSQLGTTYLWGGHRDAARTELNSAFAKARQLDSPLTVSAVENDLGNLEIQSGNPDAAAELYAHAARIAGAAGESLLAARAYSNTAAALSTSGNADQARINLRLARRSAHELPASHDKAFILLRLGALWLELGDENIVQVEQDMKNAYDLFTEADRLADNLGDKRASAYAIGYLGNLYEREGRAGEALSLTRRAIFLAREAFAPESLYRWQWQAARLQLVLDKRQLALAQFRHATDTLEEVRAELLVRSLGDKRRFSEGMARLYRDYVSLLLDLAAVQDERAMSQNYLWEAQETMERFKAAELEDYFQDDCVAAAREKVKRIDQVLQPDTAVVYPIVLDTRTVLLLTTATGIEAVSVDVDEKRINQELTAFRHKLEKRTTREYLSHARRLYNWLISPIEGKLQADTVTTLVVVPGGVLRTIPFAALHDGERFVIEKFAIATTPGIELTDPRPIVRRDAKVLVGGITQPRDGFGGLPYVNSELDVVQQQYGGHRLQDESFVTKALETELEGENYSIVHIASHGKFEANIEDSFILTYDDRLKLGTLERYMSVNRYRQHPVELLTLSACQTAAGDDRAALGLAGVAVKAGARSALASLWHINDQATALLVKDFYLRLQDPALSKAEALRQAQIDMLDDLRYRHPGYWSAFLLIGNWL